MKTNLTIFSIVLLEGLGIHGLMFPEADNTFPILMKLIGMADGKAFFAESFYDRTAMNWFEAEEYCSSFGMTLGEIVTEDQFKLLNSTADPELRSGSGFWTGARDSHKHSQLKWEHAGEANVSDVFMDWNVHAYLVQPLTCAYLILPPTGPAIMEIASCGANTGVLCQT